MTADEIKPGQYFVVFNEPGTVLRRPLGGLERPLGPQIFAKVTSNGDRRWINKQTQVVIVDEPKYIKVDLEEGERETGESRQGESNNHVSGE